MKEGPSFGLHEKLSVSLDSLLARSRLATRPARAARAAGFVGSTEEPVQTSDPVDVLIETVDPGALSDHLGGQQESLERLADGFVSATVQVDTLSRLVADPNVHRVQSKKRSQPRLDRVCEEIGLVSSGSRSVPETGAGVLIGVVDSGFDLSHPMFRDAHGLRVEGLLDQSDGNRTYDTAALQAAWGGGRGPGYDEDGHGTHVASIAAGSAFNGFQGIAPSARFLLVKTDWTNTDKAVAWVFRQADRLQLPCIVNLSLGHHWGAHDGTDQEERLHQRLVGPGRLLVVAAGNERMDRLHIGGQFTSRQQRTVRFEVLRQEDGSPPWAVITAWHDVGDAFDVTVTSPEGQVLRVPPLGQSSVFRSSAVEVELSRKSYAWSSSVQIQISLTYRTRRVRQRVLSGWRLGLRCQRASTGRLDAWFNNEGFGRFLEHDLVEVARTIGVPATGNACIAVASHVSRVDWLADSGAQRDAENVIGRSSPFSGLGPTRDGRSKPDVSGPGHYVTAALADGSDSADDDSRAQQTARLLTIEGTSMATPVVAGAIALMLQRKRTLDPAIVRQILAVSSRQDTHTGATRWSPTYGCGKLDIQAALSRV